MGLQILRRRQDSHAPVAAQPEPTMQERQIDPAKLAAQAYQRSLIRPIFADPTGAPAGARTRWS
jgi:hypothetical protein